jgi:arsenate reductase
VGQRAHEVAGALVDRVRGPIVPVGDKPDRLAFDHGRPPGSSTVSRYAFVTMKYALFVCSEHDGRSQMAQAFFERLAPDGIRAESAGVLRPTPIQPLVVEAMHEVGLDVARRRPRRLLVEMQIHADLAVTIGCGDVCPYVAAGVEEWAVPEPAGMDLAGVRALRDDIERLVGALVADRLPDLLGDRTPHQSGLMQLLPALVDEFQGARSPQQIRSCADAVLSRYDTAPLRSDLLTLAHERTQTCLRADVCDPCAPARDRLPEMVIERATRHRGLTELRPMLVDEVRDRHPAEHVRARTSAILDRYGPARGHPDVRPS